MIGLPKIQKIGNKEETVKKKILLIPLALLLAALLLPACAPAAPAPAPPAPPAPAPPAPAPPAPAPPAPEEVEVIEWKCQNYFPGGIPWFEITARCDDYIEEMSGGRLVITSYPEAALIPTAEIASAVGAGTVEMGMTCGGYHMGLIPVAAFEGAQPMAMGGPQRDYFFIDYGGADIVRRAYAEHNIYWTFCYDDTQALLMTTVPVWTADDLKGLKLRSYGASSKMWDGLGATTKWVPGGEIYLGLATGVFDGAHYMGPFAEYELGFHEVCKYILIDPPAYYAGDGANLVNLDAWNSLSEDLQAIIMSATMDTANEHRRYAEAMDDIYLAKMVDEWGVTKTWWPAEDMALAQEVATDVWWYFAQEDEYSMEFYELMMDFMREIGKVE